MESGEEAAARLWRQVLSDYTSLSILIGRKARRQQSLAMGTQERGDAAVVTCLGKR